MSYVSRGVQAATLPTLSLPRKTAVRRSYALLTAWCLTFFALLPLLNAKDFEVRVDPQVALQGDEPMTFTVSATDQRALTTVEWRHGDIEVLGNEATLTLPPTFTENTILTVTAQDATGSEATSRTTILVGDGEPSLSAWIDPPQVTQGRDRLLFHARVFPEDAVVTYEWRRMDTNAVVGTAAEVELAEDFQQSTALLLTVTSQAGERAEASSTITVEDGTQLDVVVAPPLRIQGAEPLDFEAWVGGDHDIVSYEWRRTDTQEVLGEGRQVSFPPVFTGPVPISVLVTAADGATGIGEALILANPDSVYIDVVINPEYLVQGDAELVFQARVNHVSPITAYEWRREDTGDIIGDGPELRLAPTFEQNTGISLLVRDGEGREGNAHATVFMEEPPRPLDVRIDPPFILQTNEPMVFRAIVGDNGDPNGGGPAGKDDTQDLRYLWRNDLTGETLGETAEITLQPIFTMPTPISVEVRNATGESAWAFSFIELDGPPTGMIQVEIDPHLIVQKDQDMVFTAVVSHNAPIIAYTWVNEENGDVLGDGPRLVLAPNFTNNTCIAVTVADEAGNQGRAHATIMTEDPANYLLVQIEPPLVFQSEEMIRFRAYVENADNSALSYAWTNLVTNEVVGTEATLTLEPTFTEPTPIHLEVTTADGRHGGAEAFIEVEGEPPGGGYVFIDPPVQVQQEETMRFQAIVADDITPERFQWNNVHTGEVLGEGATLELEPIFQKETPIGLTVTDAQGQEHKARALVLIDPGNGSFLDVFVDPPIAVQGLDELHFTARVFEDVAITSYTWVNELTQEVVGTQQTLDFDETLTETTPILLQVQSADGRVGQIHAIVLVFEDGLDPNGDGQNDLKDLHTLLPRWHVDLNVLSLNRVKFN